MKIYIFVALLLLPSFTFASIDFDLKYGSKGDEVIELQEYLIDKGFLVAQPTGNFFSLTQKGVMSYQKSVGLPSTGFAGPLTRGKINADLLDTTDVEIAETGAPVEAIDTSKRSLMQSQLDELIAQLSVIMEQQKVQVDQGKTYITPGGAVITADGVILKQGINSSPVVTTNPVKEQTQQAPIVQKVFKVFSSFLDNETLTLKTDFPVNIHATKLKIKDINTGWEKTYGLDGEILDATKHDSQDDNGNVYYTYNLKFTNPLTVYATSESYFSHGTATLTLTSSDGDTTVIPIPIPQIPVKLTLGNYKNTVFGGGCDYIQIPITVLDQYNNLVQNPKVTMTNPENGMELSLVNNSFLRFSPEEVSGSLSLTIKSGVLSTTITSQVVSMRSRYFDSSGYMINARISNSNYPNLITDIMTGLSFNLETNSCK